MPTFRVKITQTYRVRMVAVVVVEADDAKSALEQQADKAAPPFGDPIWRDHWDLQDEDVDLA